MTIFRSDMGGVLKKRRRWPAVFGVAVAIVLVLVGVLVVRARSFDGGAQPPDLAVAGRTIVRLADGRQVPLSATIRPDMPTLLNLWATWCGPCRREMPRLAELRRELGPDKLNMIFLNVRDEGATPAAQAGFLRDMGLAGARVVTLPDDAIGPLTGAPDNLIPRTIMFDARGSALGRITGYKPLALQRLSRVLRE